MYPHKWPSEEGDEDNAVDTLGDPSVLEDTDDSAEIVT